MTSTDDTEREQRAQRLRSELAAAVVREERADGWRQAVEEVPRHRFTPGFYLPADKPSPRGFTWWEPVTAELDPERWLTAAYTNQSLVTQLDGDEPDWNNPEPRDGGSPTSSSTLPSLVLRMWEDAGLAEGQDILEIGTGTGYSTALACERYGSDAITSLEVDNHRLEQAADALYGLGYTPDLAVADGLYGYWPSAPFDRIVAACSVRTVPQAWIAQTRPGGKILTTLGGWQFGFGRALLTVHEDGTADGPLLPGTVSFMLARPHQAPAFGNPTHWTSLLADAPPTTTGHTLDWLTAATEQAFFTRFLIQSATPTTQTATVDGTTCLIDITTGSLAELTPDGDRLRVRQAGPVRLWDRAAEVLDAHTAAGHPGPETFRLTIDAAGQHLHHPDMPTLSLE
ncbi:ATP-grasp peptide maturase system methyltransferase [Streptomyces yaizuensis]|uniref:Protein-L-isoaspartate O-methyltransferase n=1 Tax=Streptomyces yaizuensis TaxID=2989713 RepID=A0ABQ5NXZ6_9ACTN|nr:ATP-grasp peptide maturase system methyltransferase [Streptomyces sp. YSPA8]GLF95245.1 ATP-grasp peptide maturase system methyltransferase [Streptomyces sp. YSPA8]